MNCNAIMQEKNMDNNKIIILEQDKPLNTPGISEISTEGTSASISDIEDYSNLNHMIKYVNYNCSQFFETFDLGDYISKGSSGYVYKGMYKRCKKQVAIKFFLNKNIKEKKEKEDKKENEKNINQEISLSKKLHNKNVIEIYAYFKNNKINYSVLELGKYGNIEHFLKDLLKRNAFSETAIVYFMKQVLDGLKYIHRNKICHMDVKPDNILIDLNLQVKLIDFSVSCSYANFDPEDLVKFPFVGTSKFIAPEIIDRIHMKIKEIEKLDIYSFGVTLYYLFYGEFPYKLNEVKSKNYDNILKNIKEEKLEFPKWKKISKMGKDFLEKVLEKDYSKRLNIRQALEHPWMQGAQIILDEKEKIENQECFLIKLITDEIKPFNDYIVQMNFN